MRYYDTTTRSSTPCGRHIVLVTHHGVTLASAVCISNPSNGIHNHRNCRPAWRACWVQLPLATHCSTLARSPKSPGHTGKAQVAPRALEAVNLGFASDSNTSAYNLYIPLTRQIIVINQVVFDDSSFPYPKEEFIQQLDGGDDKLIILYKASSPSKWLKYHPSMSMIKFTKVHVGSD